MQETKAGDCWLPVAAFHFPRQAWEVRAPLRGVYRIIHDPEAQTWTVFRDAGAGVTDKLGESYTHWNAARWAAQKDANRSGVTLPRDRPEGDGPPPEYNRCRIDGYPVRIVGRAPTWPGVLVDVADAPRALWPAQGEGDHLEVIRICPGLWKATERARHVGQLVATRQAEGKTWREALAQWIAGRVAVTVE